MITGGQQMLLIAPYSRQVRFVPNKRHRATTEGRPTSLFRREQLADENIDEVRLTDDGQAAPN
jgi:hypothetical protein